MSSIAEKHANLWKDGRCEKANARGNSLIIHEITYATLCGVLRALSDSLIIHDVGIRKYTDILLSETQILCNFPVQNFNALKFLYHINGAGGHL